MTLTTCRLRLLVPALVWVAGCTSFGQTTRGVEFTERYNRVVAARGSSDPMILGRAAVDAERCASDPDAKENERSRLSTASGEVDVADALAMCRKLHEEYSNRLASGMDCEAREFVIWSDITGEGRWTEPRFDRVNGDKFVPARCADAAQGTPAAGFENLRAAIQKECGGEIHVVIASQWNFLKNDLGIAVRRERMATCERRRAAR